ncbi:hypothetical protein PIB30_086625, partial [Stylosanthes scabra]|nr:hypothetical protein [Stylosanthes scabra]
ASIVSVTGIAENALVKIGELTIPADFHIIKTTKREKIGRPQVLLGRPFLKIGEFKLIYYDEIFTFSVGNAIEIFHLTPLPKPRKKGIHQLQWEKGRTLVGRTKEITKAKAKPWEKSGEKVHGARKSREKSTQLKGKKKKIRLNPKRKEKVSNHEGKKKKKKKELENDKGKRRQKKKEGSNEDKTEQTKMIKCSSFNGLLGKLKSLTMFFAVTKV